MKRITQSVCIALFAVVASQARALDKTHQGFQEREQEQEQEQRQVQTINLRFEIKQGRSAIEVKPLHAEVGQFGLSRSLPDSAALEKLHVVVKNRRGDRIHTVALQNHLQRHVETFDPQTGAIEISEMRTQPSAMLDVVVPFGSDVASVEIVADSKMAGAPMQSLQVQAPLPLLTLDRKQIQGMAKRAAQERGTLAPAPLAATPTLTTILNNGTTASKMDFVFIGDGYTAAEMSKWRSDAQQVIDAFKADPLLAANLGKINIHRVDIASNQSGVDQPDYGIYVDTAMDGAFNCANIARLLCVDDNKVISIVSKVLPADGREEIVVISNSTRYGGSGGAVAAVSMASSSKEIALHEIGHSAFYLADEYDYGPVCDLSHEPAAGDVTLYGTRSNSKWGDLISASTPVPTPLGAYANGTVGIFQGGNYCTSGVYRPTENSRMRALGNPWHAVNTRLANKVFAAYSGSSGNGGWVTQTGNLVAGASAKAPNTSPNYVQSGAGTIGLKLTGAAGTNFNLYLYQWNGSAWAQVASATTTSSTETLNYAGTAAYYYVEVRSASGSGSYTLQYYFPPK